MKKIVLFCLIFATGCGSQVEEDNRIAQDTVSSSPSPTVSDAVETGDSSGQDKHEHSAPHGGTLIVFEDEFAHLEMVVDPETGEITTYALDGEAEKAVLLTQESIVIEIERPRKTEITLNAVENLLTGEKIGSTSEFRGQNDELKGLTDFDGHIRSITIRGREFRDIEFNFPKGNEEGHDHI